MTDARQEDQERIVGQPIEAQQDGVCKGCGKAIRGSRRDVEGQMIVERFGAWVHAPEPGSVWSCVDDYEAKRAETDRERAA